MERGDIGPHIEALEAGYYHAVAVAGGDGTVSIAANALLKSGLKLPMLIIPAGTANDFAASLKIPADVGEAAALIKNKPAPCDAGLVNGRFFINVCAAGFLADVSQVVNKNLKDSLGNLAYYLTGLGKLANLKPLKVRITNSAEVIEEDIYLFLALNSSGIGGFSKLSPGADVTDGLFDIIAVKAINLMELAALLMKLLSGEHLNDPNVIYFRDNYVKVEPLFDDEDCMNTDVDGEAGPKLPLEIENRRHALQVFMPRLPRSRNRNAACRISDR
jgi:YegS/Rv2252/BmrU family lipid kinase